MWKNLRTAGMSLALCSGFAVASANAAESRLSTFAFACDGVNKFILIDISGLGNSTTRFIQSVEISIFENHGGLQYIVLGAQNDPKKQLMSLGSTDNRAANLFISSLVPVATSPIGTVQFTINGSCAPGSGQVQGIVIFYFFS